MVEVMVALCVAGLVGAIAIPTLTAGLSEARTRGSARYLGARFQQARTLAALRGRAVAVRIQLDRTHVVIGMFEDGNANGVRTVDIASGDDARIGPDITLESLFPGVRPTEADGVSEITGLRNVLVSFSAVGTASSTTVYLRGGQDGRFAVRVLGATGRIRLLRFDLARADWVDL